MTRAVEDRAIEASMRAEVLGHDLDVARESIRRLEESLTAMRTTATAIEERHAGQLQARDERIASLTADFARKETDYAARIAELDGVRKHALRQIDESRTEARHWKAEFDRVDHENRSTLEVYRQKANTIGAELAAARGRLGAVEEALGAAVTRTRDLEGELSIAKKERESAAASADTAVKRFGAGRLRGNAVAVRRRKL
jgi:chromosome segregation ATPase